MINDLQKASMWKRMSAALFDAILLGIVAVLFAWLVSAAVQYDTHSAALNDAYTHYAEAYQVDFSEAVNHYDALTEEEIARVDEAYAALSSDPQAMQAYEMMLRLTLIIATFGILLAYVVMEFTIPMALGNGQTLGKKIFGIGLMQLDGTQLSGIGLFIRTILGKFTIETMIPVLIILMMTFGAIGLIGPIIIFTLLVVNAVMLFATRTRALMHDKLASTVCVDIGSQMIFKNRDELIRYKQKRAADKAARKPY